MSTMSEKRMDLHLCREIGGNDDDDDDDDDLHPTYLPTYLISIPILGNQHLE